MAKNRLYWVLHKEPFQSKIKAIMDTQLSDEQIAQQVQQGKTQNFGLLVERFEPKLKRYAKKFLFDQHDSQDVVQEVFLKAFVNIKSFDSTRNFSSWIYRIAHNLFINVIKKRGKEPVPFFDADTIFPHPVSKDNPEKEVDKKQIQEIMTECLSHLDPKYRETLILFYFEDLDYQQISEIMQIPKSTVGVRLSRAKTILKQIYQQLNPHHSLPV